ncbi:MAG: sensor domain-containing diguanylate cyclase [Myxococcales bacterium]|nr:sensor domain-containing diguanylate cyclase [Myxococcales bacterium]
MDPIVDLFPQLVESLREGVYLVDRDRLITYWNSGAEAITGFSRDEVVGHHCFANILRHIDEAGTQLCFKGCPLQQSIRDGQKRQAAVYLHHKDGHRVLVNVQTVPIRDGQGAVIGGLEVFHVGGDRTTAEQLEALRQKALIDDLTGVANRRFAEIELNARIRETDRYDWRSGFIFVDVDHFKSVNDRFGHPVGDQVLKMVAATLSGAVRSHDMVARWGGEEFVALFSRLEGNEQLRMLAERLRMLVERSGLRDEARSVKVTISLGATMVRSDDSLESLVKRADDLMYRAKTGGRNRVELGSAD